jgi:hypothetical protein
MLDELAGVVAQVASRWKRSAMISRTWDRESLEGQIVAVTKEVYGNPALKPLTSHTDITLPKGNIEADTPIYLGEACFQLLTAPAPLDAVN